LLTEPGEFGGDARIAALARPDLAGPGEIQAVGRVISAA
jgi:hypothetical protein